MQLNGQTLSLLTQPPLLTMGGPVGPVAPPTAGLVGWWKADAEAFADLDPVGQLTDFSGQANHLLAAGTARPTFRTNQVNGLPCLRFNGTTNFLAKTSGVAGFGGTPAGFTAIAVVRANVVRSAFTQVVACGNGTQVYEVRLNGNAFNYEFAAISGINKATTIQPFVNAGYDVVTGSYDDASNALQLYIKNAPQFSAVEAGTVTVTQLAIGGRPAGSLFWQDDICEVRLFNVFLSQADIDAEVAYLTFKWLTVHSPINPTFSPDGFNYHFRDTFALFGPRIEFCLKDVLNNVYPVSIDGPIGGESISLGDPIAAANSAVDTRGLNYEFTNDLELRLVVPDPGADPGDYSLDRCYNVYMLGQIGAETFSLSDPFSSNIAYSLSQSGGLYRFVGDRLDWYNTETNLWYAPIVEDGAITFIDVAQ